MALKPCRECGKEVSDTATKCPHCGIDHPASAAAGCGAQMQRVGCALTLLVTVPVLLFAFLLGGC
jgi:hypothetical protein